MRSFELLEKILPIRETKVTGQRSKTGPNVNLSGIFSQLIKDAARCNHYNSDVYYSLKDISEMFQEYNEHPENGFRPIWIGFRKMGVDSNSYIFQTIDDDGYSGLSSRYFALYSVSVNNDDDGWFEVSFREYAV